MRNNWKKIFGCVALMCTLCVGLALGASNGKKIKLNGLITGRDGENLTVKNLKGAGNVVVVLTDETKVQSPKGLGMRHSEQAVTALIPGLKIQVEGTGTDSRVVAKSITLSKDDLLMAEMIQAGLDPTKQQQQTNTANIAGNKQDIQANNAASEQRSAANAAGISANRGAIASNQQEIQATTKRFNDLAEYETKATATVHFASGSDKISDSDKATLTTLAQAAVGLTGYIIQVKGFADSSGNAAMNQQLSMDRAQAVIAYLLQDCNVPLRHIVAPGAMGTADPAAPNESADGRADNRRVDVKVVVNKGIAGGM